MVQQKIAFPIPLFSFSFIWFMSQSWKLEVVYVDKFGIYAYQNEKKEYILYETGISSEDGFDIIVDPTQPDKYLSYNNYVRLCVVFIVILGIVLFLIFKKLPHFPFSKRLSLSKSPVSSGSSSTDKPVPGLPTVPYALSSFGHGGNSVHDDS